MRQFATFCAVAACIGIASTSALAQEVGIYVGPPDTYVTYYEPDYYGPGYSYDARVYRYRYWQRSDDRFSVEPEVGTNQYWADRDSNTN